MLIGDAWGIFITSKLKRYTHTTNNQLTLYPHNTFQSYQHTENSAQSINSVKTYWFPIHLNE